MSNTVRPRAQAVRRLGNRPMAGVVSRESYFETGSSAVRRRLRRPETGRGVDRLGVTTGSFYHYFSGWPTYTGTSIAHWMQARTVWVVEAVRTEPDPRKRIDTLIQVGMELPHGAEAAIRSWTRWTPTSMPCRSPSTNSASTSCTSRPSRYCKTSARRGCSLRGGSTCWSATSRPPCLATPMPGVDRRPAARGVGFRPVRIGTRR